MDEEPAVHAGRTGRVKSNGRRLSYGKNVSNASRVETKRNGRNGLNEGARARPFRDLSAMARAARASSSCTRARFGGREGRKYVFPISRDASEKVSVRAVRRKPPSAYRS